MDWFRNDLTISLGALSSAAIFFDRVENHVESESQHVTMFCNNMQWPHHRSFLHFFLYFYSIASPFKNSLLDFHTSFGLQPSNANAPETSQSHLSSRFSAAHDLQCVLVVSCVIRILHFLSILCDTCLPSSLLACLLSLGCHALWFVHIYTLLFFF